MKETLYLVYDTYYNDEEGEREELGTKAVFHSKEKAKEYCNTDPDFYIKEVETSDDLVCPENKYWTGQWILGWNNNDVKIVHNYDNFYFADEHIPEISMSVLAYGDMNKGKVVCYASSKRGQTFKEFAAKVKTKMQNFHQELHAMTNKRIPFWDAVHQLEEKYNNKL